MRIYGEKRSKKEYSIRPLSGPGSFNQKIEAFYFALARDQQLRELKNTIAQALHIETGKNPVQRCLDVCKATATNISSMLQDFRNQKQSEIMAINGALVQEAKKVGIATPENDLLIQRVQQMWPKII